MLALLLQIDWNKFRPEQIFGGQVLERTPAGLTIVFLIGIGILLGFLFISFFDNFSRPKFLFEYDLPPEVKRRLTQTITNRSIRVWQIVFVLLAFTVFGFQVYWTYYADEANEQFQALAYKDLRNRRTTAASLRGWMLDRTGKLGAALAYYKVNNNGEIDRTFSLEREMAHLLGTERGTPGLERTLYSLNADPMPEAWEILTKYKKPEPEQKDVRITIDRDLQAYSAKLLEGKKGGIVVINPQTGDVLAMYSNPSYSLSDAETLEGFLKLEADKDQKPLLNRATREFYIPGSTFKTFTMVSAFRAGRPDLTFPGRPADASPPCYTPFRGSKPICDAGGSCHACAENIPIREAYKVSSNQYFAQLANALGRDRMAETARIFGIAPTENPDEALSQGYFPDIWNASSRRIANSIAPARATIVTGKLLTLFDFGQEGMGQGYAGQMTPFQMALIAAAPANLQGRLMKPKIEADIQPQMFSQVLTPQQAAVVREIMSTVTEESGGTGSRVKAKLGGTGIVTGGKTGTAEKDGVPAYDRSGKRVTVTKRKRNEAGELITYEEPVFRRRTDGWFICIAPLENPTLAIAVVVEDIGNGFGGTTAAPIAADVILKARELGLLGERYAPKPAAQTPPKRKGRQ
ncbi:MAG TPA: penicillin-binding transpeptidase domain-containing protein [Pyrinomonadaceae bacterium]|jgi:cell division protein FtsI/penicillin-binding protein 2|nr:penicillin-binding transpeptidase domain-containing protein [Pyrinomonadaceae bacterium]